MAIRSKSRDAAIAFGLPAAVALLLYLATAARDIVVGDPTEFVLVSLTGGVAHAPGYPLLTMLGRLFSLLPLEPAPFRMNLVPVLAAAAGVGMVGLIAHRLGASALAAAAGAVAFATVPVVWRWSLVAEPFALNDLLVTVVIIGIVAWRSEPGRTWPLLLAAFAGGLILTNHHTGVLALPLVGAALWHGRDDIRRRPWLLAAAAGAVVVALAPYAYVPIASAARPAWNWGDVGSLEDLLALIARQTYGTTQLVSEAAVRGGTPIERVGLFLGSYTTLEAILVGIGALLAAVSRRWYLVGTAAAWLLAGPGFAAYADIDPRGSITRVVLERFFLLAHTLTAPLMGLAVWRLAEGASELTRAPRARLAVPGAVAFLAAALVLAAFASIDRREDRVARSYGFDILQSVEQGAILMTTGDDASLAVEYLQVVEGVRPDVTHVAAPLLRTDWYVLQVRERHPDVVVPFERLGGPATLRTFLDANPRRTIGVVGGLIDDSLKDSHYLYIQGLVQVLRPLPPTEQVETLLAENARLYARYRPPRFEQVRYFPWERAILGDYARAAFLVGQQLEIAKRYSEARAWYTRALEIDREYERARRALVQLP